MFFQKLICSNLSIFATQCSKPLIFQTMNFVRSNTTCLKYLRLTPSGCMDMGIGKSQFVAKTQHLYKCLIIKYFAFSSGIVEEANINRSPTSYDANPAEERAKYSGNTDKEMVQLNFFNDAGQALGVLNWFAVHPTSMNNTNLLISGDNKGAASQMFEKEMNPNYVTGQGPFVAAFASTNLGDISPNIMVNKGTVMKSDSVCEEGNT